MVLANLQVQRFLNPTLHVLFWALIISSPYLFGTPAADNSLHNWQYKLIINNSLLACLFYVNAYFIYPEVYKRKGLLVYLLLAAAIIILLMLFARYLDSAFVADKEQWFKAKYGGFHGRKRLLIWYFTNLLTYIFIFGISFSYRNIKDHNRAEKVRKEKEHEHLKSELTFLRSQVSPHFMFNVLNTLVALARKKSDLLEPSLIQLSGLMRYMLYESNEDRISIEKEVEYLKSYIDLQMLRFGEDVEINLQAPNATEGYEIEPMLLISFVENAFKHGIGLIKEPYINIYLAIDHEKHWLEFRVENAVSPQQTAKDKTPGIGLVNMRRRLELLYKDNYILDTRQISDTFISVLKVKLR